MKMLESHAGIERSGATLPSRLVTKIACTLTASLLVAMAQTAVAGPALTVNEDGAHRDARIHWPAGFTPDDADLFGHNEITIDASCETVWKHLVAAPLWPSWYSNAHNVVLQGTQTDHLAKGTKFEFDTFGQHFSAHVAEFSPPHRLAWFGNGTGNSAYHPWLLIKDGQSCHVVTEEVAKGPNAAAIRDRDPNAMHRGHDLWLQGLKTVSEQH